VDVAKGGGGAPDPRDVEGEAPLPVCPLLIALFDDLLPLRPAPGDDF